MKLEGVIVLRVIPPAGGESGGAGVVKLEGVIVLRVIQAARRRI